MCEDLESLLHLADLYLMDDLKNAAGLLLAGGLNKENIFDNDISLLADKFRAEALRNKCVDYLFDNASSIDDERFGVLTEGVVRSQNSRRGRTLHLYKLTGIMSSQRFQEGVCELQGVLQLGRSSCRRRP